MPQRVRIEVACAMPDKQCVKALTVPSGCTALQAVDLSNIAAEFPGLNLSACRFGLFSQLLDKPEQHVLADGDRVEIYRPLLLDPKEARRQRAAKIRRS